MNGRELADRSGLPARQIRYLVAEGILPGAGGAAGRRADGYGEEHLRMALLYARLSDSGLSARTIRELLVVWTTLPDVFGDGVVEVRVRDRNALASMDDARVAATADAIGERLLAARDQLRTEGRDAGDEQGQAAEGGHEAAGRSPEGVR